MEKFKEFWRRFKIDTIWLAVWFSLGFVVYFYIQRGTSHSARLADVLRLPEESLIPFWPSFVWIYITLWPVMVLPFYIYVLPRELSKTGRAMRYARRRMGIRGRAIWFTLWIFGKIEDAAETIFGYEPDPAKMRKMRAQIMLSYLFTIMVLSLSHYMMPFRMDRPRFNPGTLTLWVLGEIYRLDGPNNLFPSLHASFAFLVCFIFNRVRSSPLFLDLKVYVGSRAFDFPVSRVGFGFYIWASLVVLSTYFVKQHMVLDGVSGFLLGYAAYRIGFSAAVWRAIARILPFLEKTAVS